MRAVQVLKSIWIVWWSVFLLASCATDVQRPLVKDTFGDECGEIKVPLPLASKVFTDREGHQSIHIWRVGVTCRLQEVRMKETSRLRIENLEIQLVMKGFVENSFRDEFLDASIVIVAKDEINGEIKAKYTEQIRLQVREGDLTIEQTFRFPIALKNDTEDESPKRMYPTIFVAIGLDKTEWRKYKALIEEVGERALLPEAKWENQP